MLNELEGNDRKKATRFQPKVEIKFTSLFRWRMRSTA